MTFCNSTCKDVFAYFYSLQPRHIQPVKRLNMIPPCWMQFMLPRSPEGLLLMCQKRKLSTKALVLVIVLWHTTWYPGITQDIGNSLMSFTKILSLSVKHFSHTTSLTWWLYHLYVVAQWDMGYICCYHRSDAFAVIQQHLILWGFRMFLIHRCHRQSNCMATSQSFLSFI